MTCCAPMRILTIPQPTLTFAIHLHGRLVVLAPFLCVVPLSIVSEALHLPLWLQVTTARAYWFLLDGGSTAVYLT
jgi:hypothetical protein